MSLKELKSLFDAGVNISQRLREESGESVNTESLIELCYEVQAGTYIDNVQKPDVALWQQMCSEEIARLIRSLRPRGHVMEAGVGEATTLAGVIDNLADLRQKFYGFDISWSRVNKAREFLGGRDATLCTGNLTKIPFADSSMDIVYTCHSIEPNGGSESAILSELYRVASRYLILVEPEYSIADAGSKLRMDSLGYCKDLRGHARRLGMRVHSQGVFPFTMNASNPSGVLIIVKEGRDSGGEYACPASGGSLWRGDSFYYSESAGVAYPILKGIPCLRVENGIAALGLGECGSGEREKS